jgi:hypothetical protein
MNLYTNLLAGRWHDCNKVTSTHQSAGKVTAAKKASSRCMQ